MEQAGVPIEFNNVCSMMRWFQKKPNVNFKTQVIGFSAEKMDKIYPIESESDTCVWTEWFDHDTPCNSKGDTESHEEHFMKLQESWTGSMRICKPTEMVSQPATDTAHDSD